MKILVIFTGGTIGSRFNNGFISPDSDTKHTLIEHYKEAGDGSVEFVEMEPYSILSENLSAKYINALVRAVDEGIHEDYDGIIVTHGTDTLQYSASALGIFFGDGTMPIVLVSSNYPLSDERANGHANFAAAVDFIKAKSGKGVFVAYQNEGDVVKFHQGRSVLAHREADDAIFSIGSEYAVVKDGKIEILCRDEKSVSAMGVTELAESPKILVISSFPGDDYIYPVEKYNAVILRPYHSGTLNTSSERLRAFCNKAKENNIPVYMVNARREDVYASVKALDELGIIAREEAFIGLYMRLWIEISRK